MHTSLCVLSNEHRFFFADNEQKNSSKNKMTPEGEWGSIWDSNPHHRLGRLVCHLKHQCCTRGGQSDGIDVFIKCTVRFPHFAHSNTSLIHSTGYPSLRVVKREISPTCIHSCLQNSFFSNERIFTVIPLSAKNKPPRIRGGFILGGGRRTRTAGLQLMRLMRCRFSIPLCGRAPLQCEGFLNRDFVNQHLCLPGRRSVQSCFLSAHAYSSCGFHATPKSSTRAPRLETAPASTLRISSRLPEMHSGQRLRIKETSDHARSVLVHWYSPKDSNPRHAGYKPAALTD